MANKVEQIEQIQESESEEMLTPPDFAVRRGVNYRRLMRMVDAGLIKGVVRSASREGGHYRHTLIPANAEIPEPKLGRKPREKRPPTPREVMSIMNSIDLSPGDQKKLVAVRAAQALKLSETAYEKQFGSEQATWAAKLDDEHENFLNALDHFHDEGDHISELTLAVQLSPFWNLRGHWTEGRKRLIAAIEVQPIGHTILKGRAFGWLSYFTYRQGEYDKATPHARESLEIAQAVHDREGMALALHSLAFIAEAQGRYEEAKDLFNKCKDEAATAKAPWLIIWALRGLGFVFEAEANWSAAKAVVRQSLDLAEEIQNIRGIAGGKENLGALALKEGDYDEARILLREGLALNLGMGNKNGIANCYYHLGTVEHASGDHQAACRYFQRSLKQHVQTGDKFWFPIGMEAIGRMAHALGDDHTAARLFGAAHKLRETISTPLSPADEKNHGQLIREIKKRFHVKWAEGAASQLDDVLSFALAYGNTEA